MTWVFGYGSLMWNPGFPTVEKRPAVLKGYQRAAMMYSTRNRGTPEQPGMVISLIPGGQCVGMAWRVEPGKEAEAREYLLKREGVDRANKMVLMPVHWHEEPNAPVQHAWVFLPILSYCNYIWGVPTSRRAELVARGSGKTGSSYDYVRLMLEELHKINVGEPSMEALLAEARRIMDGDGRPADASAAD